MLLRHEDGGVVAVGQPAHAFVAGELCRAWADLFTPREEVCLAAEQHDVGWTEWKAAPELDPDTGLPYSFGALPVARRLALWTGAGERLLSQSRYAALLVSRYGTLLVERFPPQDERAAEAFLAHERAFQERVLATLRADPAYFMHAAPGPLSRNRELIFTCDAISLALVHGVRERRTIGEYALTPVGDDLARVRVSPWPFAPDDLTVVCDGRRLDGPYADEAAMRQGLAAAPWTTITTQLVSE